MRIQVHINLNPSFQIWTQTNLPAEQLGALAFCWDLTFGSPIAGMEELASLGTTGTQDSFGETKVFKVFATTRNNFHIK